MIRILFVISFMFAVCVAQANESVQELLVQPPVQDSTEQQPLNTTAAVVTENQIPVHLETEKKTSASGNPFVKVLAAVLGIGLLASGAVLFIKRYMRNSGQMKTAPQIKVLTQHYLGPKKHLAIIRVAGESILIGITDHNINLIKSLSLLDEEIPEQAPNNFDRVFLEKNLQATVAENRAEGAEDFSIRGIRDVVSNRLKGMRSIQ